MEAKYIWHDLYRSAILEANNLQLETRIRKAQLALTVRQHELKLNGHGTVKERQALENALANLELLRVERLGVSQTGK